MWELQGQVQLKVKITNFAIFKPSVADPDGSVWIRFILVSWIRICFNETDPDSGSG